MANEKSKRPVAEWAKRNLKTFNTYLRGLEIQLYTFLSHDGMMHNPIEYKPVNVTNISESNLRLKLTNIYIVEKFNHVKI